MPLPRGFVPRCLPTKAQQPPSGEAWLHEINHDGFRVIARKDGNRVRLYSRNDLTYRFLLIVVDAGSAALTLVHHRRRGGRLRGALPAERRPKRALMVDCDHGA